MRNGGAFCPLWRPFLNLSCVTGNSQRRGCLDKGCLSGARPAKEAGGLERSFQNRMPQGGGGESLHPASPTGLKGAWRSPPGGWLIRPAAAAGCRTALGNEATVPDPSQSSPDKHPTSCSPDPDSRQRTLLTRWVLPYKPQILPGISISHCNRQSGSNRTFLFLLQIVC